LRKNAEKLEKDLERLKRLVYYDELTGVLNRRGFAEEAGRAFRAVSFGRAEIERRIGFRIPFSVLFIDLDDFKKLNDTRGHEEGDKALKKAAEIMGAGLRASDVFARWGGEEFVVALLGATGAAAKAVAEKLRHDITKAGLSASIGVASYQKEKNLAELVDSADKAMYQAKRKGKNRVVALDN